MKIFILIIFWLSSSTAFAAETFVLKGKIRDAETQELLKRVTVKDLSSKKMTFSNQKGEYELKFSKKGTYSIEVRMIGYEEISKNIEIKDDTLLLDFSLNYSKFETKDVVVFAENYATRLMRKVISRKLEQEEKLNQYSYTLYNKFIAQTDTLTAGRADTRLDSTIISILESYSKGYYKKSSKYFNLITQKRQSINVPPQANFFTFGTNLNAYEDFVQIFNEKIATPFNQDAPDWYNFEELGYYKSNGKKYLKISAKSNSILRPLFEGELIIDEEGLFPISVDLIPSPITKLPFGAEMKFNQEFSIFDSLYLMPTRMKINATTSAELLWVINPRLDILIETAAFDYDFYSEINDNIFEQRRVETAENANEFDSKFWSETQILPLKEDEIVAYDNIRRSWQNPDSIEATNIIDKIFMPVTKTVRYLSRPPFTGFPDFIRYNRVYGAYLGFGLLKEFDKTYEIKAKAGYGFADRKFEFITENRIYLDSYKNFSLELDAYTKLARIDKEFVVQSRNITWQSFIFKSDYGDYYYKDGLELALNYGIGQLQFIRREVFEKPYTFKIFYRNENHNSAFTNTNFALLNWNSDFRENMLIEEGKFISTGFAINLNYNQERRISNFGIHLEGEFANSEVFGGNFTFSQYFSEFSFKTKTLPSMTLDCKVSAGISFENLPLQRIFSLESAVSNTATFGAFRTMRAKEFYGDTFWSVNMEHNFGEILPGLLTIDNIASFGMDIIAIGNIAWTGFTNSKLSKIEKLAKYNLKATNFSNDKYFYELGLGLNKLFLFFRFDLTARFSQLEQPKFVFTISGAQF